MSETRIIELQQELAEELAKEAQRTGFDLVVFNDADDLVKVKVKPRELTPQNQTEVLSISKEIYSNIDEITDIVKKIEEGGATTEMALKLLFIIETPLKTILSIFFDIEKEKVATLPNIDLLLSIVQGSEFGQIQEKTSKAAKEIDYMSKSK